jgi:hypothetical protein
MTTTSRRAVLAGAAILPAISLPALATSDPSFEAVKRYRTAKEDLEAQMDKVSSEEYVELYNEYASAGDAVLAAIPTTRAGAIALITLMLEHRHEEFPAEEGERERTVLGNLRAAIPNLA